MIEMLCISVNGEENVKNLYFLSQNLNNISEENPLKSATTFTKKDG